MKKIVCIIMVVASLIVVGCNSETNEEKKQKPETKVETVVETKEKIIDAEYVQKLISRASAHDDVELLKEARSAFYSLSDSEKENVKNVIGLCASITRHNVLSIQKIFEEYDLERELKDTLLNPASLQVNNKEMRYGWSGDVIECTVEYDFSAQNMMGGYGRDKALYRLVVTESCRKYACTGEKNTVPEIFDKQSLYITSYPAVNANIGSLGLIMRCKHK